jgi:hypothetical protein
MVKHLLRKRRVVKNKNLITNREVIKKGNKEVLGEDSEENAGDNFRNKRRF